MINGSTPTPAAAGAETQRTRTALQVILLCCGAATAAPIGTAFASPYHGTPFTVPGTIEAEAYDRGGEGVGYHDLTPNNDTGRLRPSESVDIRDDPRAPNSNWLVTEFQPDEWMAYTINVTSSGVYRWGLHTATPYGGGSYYLQIDGRNVSGVVTVPNTGSLDAFRWVPAPDVWLAQGQHVLKIVAANGYFDVDNVVIMAGQSQQTAAPQSAPTFQSSAVDFACTFNTLSECGIVEQAKVLGGRASLTSIARDGGTALRLHTEPGDTGVVYSGAMERDDIYLATPGTAAPVSYGQGVEQWWAHSVLFPDDFVAPTTQAYTIFDFHNTGTSPAQANFNLAFRPVGNGTQPGALSIIGYGGSDYYGRYDAVIGQVQKNVWYDFVYHVRWSAGDDGLFVAWVNGKLVLLHQGPTLYPGQKVYLKLANYHQPVCNWYQGCIGDQATSVIHDRVILGKSAQAVSSGPLEQYPF